MMYLGLFFMSLALAEHYAAARLKPAVVRMRGR